MFRIHGEIIFFKEWRVGRIDGLVGESVRRELIFELEHHTSTDAVTAMINRLAALEKPEKLGDPEDLVGAVWDHV